MKSRNWGPLFAPLVIAAALWPVAIDSGIACAAEGARASLVVDTGTEVLNYCVSLPDESVTGMELIELASQQHGLSYKLGFGGAAVCMLAGVGPTGSNCFEEDPDFWGYWRGDGSGGWTWSGAGATTTSVGEGDVEGWAWGSGTGPDTHPAPPNTKFGNVCAPAPPSDGHDEPKRPKKDEPAGPGGPQPSPDPAPSPAPEGTDRSRDKPRGKHRGQGAREKKDRPSGYVVSTGARPKPTPSSRAAPVELTSEDGPSMAGLAAIVATVALGGAAAVLGRRRRSEP